MPDQNFDETRPVPIKQPLEQTQPNQSLVNSADTVPVPIKTPLSPVDSKNEPPDFSEPENVEIEDSRGIKVRKALSRVLVIVLGLIIVIAAGGGGGWYGYQMAIRDRMQKQSEAMVNVATEQFMLALQDQAEGRLDVARRRLEYVLQLDPTFPGAMQKLTEVMTSSALTATPNTPTPAPTITPTPTPDTRGIDEKYNQALRFYQNKEWVNLLNAIESVRKTDLNYKTVEVDGLNYIALRFRGIDKILKEGNLEGGIFDLVMVERFGPLDTEANGFRNWARIYLTGSSYWEIDWEQVVSYFGQVAPALPNLRDGAGMTASERYRIGSIRYGDKLVQEGQHCQAVKQYRNALALFPDPKLIPVATEVANICNPPATPTVKPTAASTPTPTRSGGAPTQANTTQPPPQATTPAITPTVPTKSPTPITPTK